MPVSVVPGRSAPLGSDNAMRTIIPNLAEGRKRDSAECERRRQRCSSHVRPSSDDHTLYATTLPRDRENEPSQWLGAGVACLLWLPSLAADDAFFFSANSRGEKNRRCLSLARAACSRALDESNEQQRVSI